MSSRSGDAAAGDAPQVEASASPGRGTEGLLSSASSGNLEAGEPLEEAQCDAAPAVRQKPLQWMTQEYLRGELCLPACIDYANMRGVVKKEELKSGTHAIQCVCQRKSLDRLPKLRAAVSNPNIRLFTRT